MTLFAAVLALVSGGVLAHSIWRHRLNPILIGVLIWAPALLLSTLPREFNLPIYSHLNRDIGLGVVVAMLLSFIFFSAGVCAVLAVVGSRDWDKQLARRPVNVSDRRMALLFGLGFLVFAYSFSRAGLGDVANLDPKEVAESRQKLHLGALSFVTLFLDIGAVVFLARMLETRRFIFGIPMVLATLCYMITLHKSPTLFLALSAVFLFMLEPDAAREMLFGTTKRRLTSGLLVLIVAGAMFVMNALRGIGVISMTTFEWPWFEQIYIYSGATAILNLSASIEGYVRVDPPTMGLLLAKPLTWHLVDRNLLDPTRYFEGINAATYLAYPWSDFRWAGFAITPFLTGALISLFFHMALQRTIYGLMFGAIAFKAVVFSVNTDVIFDPTTLIQMAIAVLAHLFAAKPRAQSIKCQTA